jgi:uncharacterized protein YjbI with pentapeptide repeats
MSDLEAKPKSTVWTKPVRLARGGMFKALGKLFVSGATQNWAGAARDALDVAAAVGQEADAGEQAGLLITRALGRALLELLDPYKMGFDEDVATDPEGIAAQIDAALAEQELVIDHRFLEHPRELAILEWFEGQILRWLEPVDLRGRDPKSIAARLPEYFVHALHREAIDRRGDYDRLFAEFEGEFDAAYRRERSWAGYRAWFLRELEGPVLGDSFSLPQVFVWPRAYHVEDAAPTRGRGRHPIHEPAEERRVVAWLRDTLDAWMAKADPHDAVRVISGDPGAGKSSFARMYAAHRMTKGERVLYVPLHLFDVQGDLGASLAKLCDEIAAFPELALEGDAAERELLLVLDGLDELSKQGRMGARLADEFVTEVLSKVDKHNYGGLRLSVLLCGRPIAVQGVQSRFRKPGQVVHLLPYCLTERERQLAWMDADDILGLDQRDEWWLEYGAHTGAGYEALPEALCGDALIETTRQPLLGYLLALVYEHALREGRELQKDISRNEIYDHLIERVYAREWGARRGHPALEGVEAGDFRELLEDMALAAWHDGERVTTVAAVEHLQGPTAAERLRAYAEQCEGVGQLFTAFYMRRHGRRHDGEETFEFTHKSFAEYLTASRMVAQVEVASRALDDQKRASGRRRDRGAHKHTRDILVEWLEVFGPTAISHDLLPYLRKEVALRDADDPGLARRWQLALIELIEQVLREGSPCEEIRPPLRFIDMCSWARNAEEALLVLLSCCSDTTEEISKIDWPERTSFGSWIRRLRDQPDDGLARRTIVGMSLTRLDLSNLALGSAELLHTNLAHSVLSQANLDCANLAYTNLAHANLAHANLDYANLTFTILDSVNLAHASLGYANLAHAALDYANLTHTNLTHANLDYVSLTYTHLDHADMTSAILVDTHFYRTTVSPKQFAKTYGTPAVLPDDD